MNTNGHLALSSYSFLSYVALYSYPPKGGYGHLCFFFILVPSIFDKSDLKIPNHRILTLPHMDHKQILHRIL